MSVHCWEPPEASPETLAAIPDKQAISFEARIIVDGIVTSGLAFKGHEPTPLTIDNFLGQDGLTKHLAFPPFHSELLTQSFWNASESLGRIKVVISEGTYCNHQGSSFERRKNVICFAFQHAPLSILQDARIAWPNPSMFRCTETKTVSAPNSNQSDDMAHSHSPHREMNNLAINERVCTVPHAGTSVPFMLPSHELECIYEEPSTSSAPTTFQMPSEQPYMTHGRSKANRTSSSDISMPDYGPLHSWEGSRQSSGPGNAPRSLGQALSKSMSDIIYTGLRSRGHTVGTRDDSLEGLPEELDPVGIGRIEEELLTPSRMMNRTLQTYDGTSPNHGSIMFGSQHFDEAFYSPVRNTDDAGTFAPANTRVNSVTNSPSEIPKPDRNAESESPCPVFHHLRAVPVTAGDPRLSNVREISRERQAFAGSIDHDSLEGLPQIPAANDEVKGRKEGKRAQRKPAATNKRTISRKASGVNAVSPTLDPGQSGESKRKREVLETDRGSPVVSGIGLTPSPARKISKAKSQADVGMESGKVNERTRRAPLTKLLNFQ